VGSVLVGSREFINKAHRWRKMFGGGWRQAGVLAAAGLYTLDHHVERLVEDHVRATRVAEAINAMENFSVDLDAVQSNLVYVNCNIPAAEVVTSLAEHGIDMFDLPYNRVRVAIHLHITDEDVERIIAAFAAQ
jgi:threonine aldolase